MSYFISAWVSSGAVTNVEAATDPILENHLPDVAYDARVVAEVSGEYQDAGEVFPLLGWNGSELTGLNFVSQAVVPS